MVSFESNLNGKVAFVTGASRGIGAATALELARCGADVVIAYHRSRHQAESISGQVREFGRQAVILQCDVADRQCFRNCIDEALSVFGHIDLLINNAGQWRKKSFLNISDSEWHHMLAVNLQGVFIGCQEVFRHMEKHGGGSIVNVASVGGQIGGTQAPDYAMAKAGVISATRSLARLGGRAKIRVNCVSPGLVATDMVRTELQPTAINKHLSSIPLRRIATPEEIAQVITFLLSPRSSYITGQTVSVNGGFYMP